MLVFERSSFWRIVELGLIISYIIFVKKKKKRKEEKNFLVKEFLYVIQYI